MANNKNIKQDIIKNKTTKKAKVIVIDDKNDTLLHKKKPISKTTKKIPIPELTEFEQEFEKDKLELKKMLRYVSALLNTKTDAFNLLVLKLHKNKYTFTETECDKYYKQLLHKNDKGILSKIFTKDNNSFKVFKIMYNLFPMNESHIYTLLNIVQLYVRRYQYSMMCDKNLYMISIMKYIYETGYKFTDSDIGIILSLNTNLDHSKHNITTSLYTLILKSMNKHSRSVNGYQETRDGSTSVYKYGYYINNLNRLNTMYSRKDLMNLTHMYKGSVDQDLIETILNLTKRDDDVRNNMIMHLEQNNEFVCDSNNIEIIKYMINDPGSANDTRQNVVLKVINKFISVAPNKKHTLLNLLEQHVNYTNIFDMVLNEYVKSYNGIDCDFIRSFMRYPAISLSSDNSVQTLPQLAFKGVTYLSHIKKLTPRIVFDTTLLEVAAEHGDILMMHTLEKSGIHPTVKYLSHICTALNINEIQRLMMMKIFPDKNCAINVISSGGSDNKINEILFVLHSVGLKIDNDIVSCSIENDVKLKLHELHIKYTFDIFLKELLEGCEFYSEFYHELEPNLKKYYKLYSSHKTELYMIVDMENEFGFKPNNECLSLAMESSHDDPDIINHVINKANISITFDVLRKYIKCNRRYCHINALVDILENKFI